mgnify:CR=1 FL=1
MSQLSSFSNRFAKMTALAVLSSAVALTTGCATKRATSEVVVAPLGIPGGQGAYTGAVVVDNPVAVVDASDNMEAVVYFAFDSSAIPTNAYAALKAIAQYIASTDDAMVRLEGHGDEQGTREYNMALGERRAQAVLKDRFCRE